MEVAIVIAEQVRKEGRALEKGKTKFIRSDHPSVWGGGGISV